MAEFKQISNVDVIDALTDNDNVLVIGADGALKQTSSGNFGGKGLVITLENPNYGEGEYDTIIAQNNYDEIYDALIQGCQVSIATQDIYATRWDGGYWEGSYVGNDRVTNEGYSQEPVRQWSITDLGLMMETYCFYILFPNGSHNLPKKETPAPSAN